MLHFMLGLAGVELRDTARRAVTTVLLLALGVVLLMVAAVSVLVALFFALAERYDPIVAALLVAAISFVVAIVFMLVAYMRLKHRKRRGLPLAELAARRAAAPLAAMAPGSVPPGGRSPLNGKVLLGVAAGAALVGLILGRRI